MKNLLTLLLLFGTLGSITFAQNFSVGKEFSLSSDSKTNEFFFEDLNGDFYNDLISRDYYYLNDGKGGFNPGVLIPNSTMSIPGNFDKSDAALEVYAQKTIANTFSFYLNDGSGNLTLDTTNTSVYTHDFWRTADFDGDGNLDLLLYTKLFMGKGNGRFDPETFLSPSVANIRDVIVDYVNDDANPDIIYVSDDRVSTLLGNGDGTFTTVTQFTSSANNQDAVTMFIDEDALADLVIRKTTSILFYTSDDDGTYTKLDSVVPHIGTVTDILAYDFDGDNDDDILYNINTYNEIRVIENKGSSTFELSDKVFDLSVQTNHNVENLYKADLTNDGDFEIIVTFFNNNDVKIIDQNDDTYFNVPLKKDFNVLTASDIVLADADFNIDGNTDLLINSYADSTIAIYLGDGKGDFSMDTAFKVTILTGFNVTSAKPTTTVIEDFNDDTAIDFAVATGTSVELFLNDGAGVFSKTTVSNSAATLLVTDDFNQDGMPDIAYYAGGNVFIEFGNNDGTFTSSGETHSLAVSVLGLYTAKLNNDDYPDILGGYLNAYYLLNKKDGSFYDVQTLFGYRNITVADVNDDGLSDIVHVSSSNNISIDYNTSTDSIYKKTPSNSFEMSHYGARYVVDDFNNDGKMDLLFPAENGSYDNEAVVAYDVSSKITLDTYPINRYRFGRSSYFTTAYSAKINDDDLPDLITRTYNNDLASIVINNFELAPVPTTLPEIIDFTNITDSSFTVSWKRGDGESLHKSLEYTISNEEYYGTTTYSNDTGTVTINKTYPGAQYKFRVKECNGSGITQTCTTFDIDSVTTLQRKQVITVNMPDTVVYHQDGIKLLCSTNSDQPITYELISLINGSVSNDTLRVDSVGTYTITASQAGNDNWIEADSETFSVYVKKAPQTITFSLASSIGYREDSITFNGTTSSGLEVSYLKITGEISVLGNKMKLTGLGAAEVWAMQGGNHLFESALTVMKTFTVVKGSVAINAYNTSMAYTNDTTSLANILNLTITDNLAPEYLITSGNAVVIGDTGLVLTGTDLTAVAVEIGFSGNELYDPASDVERTINLFKGNQEITFDSIPELTENDSVWYLIGSSTSLLEVGFALTKGNATIMNDNELIINGPGITGVRAYQSGNTVFNPSNNVDQEFCIKPNAPKVIVNPFAGGELDSVIRHDNDYFSWEYKSYYDLVFYNEDTTATSKYGTYGYEWDNGTYFAQYKYVSDYGKCASELTPFTIDKQQTSLISKRFINTFTIHPNPVKNTLRINGLEDGDAIVKIISIDGQVVYENSLNSQEINVSHLSKGFYLVEVFIPELNKSMVSKIIKE